MVKCQSMLKNPATLRNLHTSGENREPVTKPILAINTATHREEVALIPVADTETKEPLKNNGKVLAQSSWKSERNESSKLIKSIDVVLRKSKLDYKDIGAILAITGPGPFSAVRIGCAVANALAYSLGIRTLALTTEGYWKLRTATLSKESPAKKLEIIISAGKGHFALLNLEDKNAFDPKAAESNHQIYRLEEIIMYLEKKHAKKPISIVCDVSPTEVDLIKKTAKPYWRVLTEHDTKQVLPLGKALLGSLDELLSTPDGNILTPRYLRPPTITLSKDPLKKLPKEHKQHNHV